MEFSPKNTFILTQDGPPSSALRIIKKGGVKIYLSNDDDMVIDYKSEGDSLGYLSLISGDKSRANVLAIEDTLCYLIPRDIILNIISTTPVFGEYFMKSFFRNYLDKTYREMRNKNLLFKEGEKLLYTTPVKDIVSRKAVTAMARTSIREAAGIMSQQGISSLVLTDDSGSPVGIITDRDLRDKVVAKGIDASGAVEQIMSSNLVTVDSHSTCFDALSVMLQRNIHHLLVTESGALQGVVTNHDFMLLQGISPLSILKNIDRQKNAEDLLAVHEKINNTISILLKEGVRAHFILRIITELHDRLIHKIIELSLKEIGESPCPFAFFVYGSEGRREETFKTVFRCAIVYDERKTYCQNKEMEEFCERLITHLQNTFQRCGLPPFDTNPLGETILIYSDLSGWEKSILLALRSHEDRITLTAKKFLDARIIYGDATIVESLKDRIYRRIKNEESYYPVIFENGARQKSPIGFFKKFVVDESGEQMERLDIKEKAIRHIADSVRALAIANNIHKTSTIERLEVLSRRGIISANLRSDIYSAFEFLLHLLLQSQLVKKESGADIDNVIETEKLSMLERKTLKEVFEIIPVLRGTVKKFFHRREAMTR